MLDKSFIEKIVELAPVELHTVNGCEYAPRPMHPVMTPADATLKIHTLAGVVAAIKCGVSPPDRVAIHIVNHEIVDVIEIDGDEWGRFPTHIHAIVGDTRAKFDYGKWYDTESFIIALQTNFVETDNRNLLIRMASAMTSERQVRTSDDGIGQQVVLKSGVHLEQKADVPNPVALRPYRTFIDVGQPESSFIFRVRGDEGRPATCALFEADGGHWRLDAMANIAKFFKESLPDAVVIA